VIRLLLHSSVGEIAALARRILICYMNVAAFAFFFPVSLAFGPEDRLNVI
jgi:hypothetical protein